MHYAVSTAAQLPKLEPFQSEALHSFTHNPHTVLIAPTGSGKSLIFQKYLYDTRNHTRAILVSPLNALARQIAEGLRSIGLNVHLGVGRDGQGPPNGNGVWIVSPEKLVGSGLIHAQNFHPNCLIVDEAHCVWEWGEKFRPEFAKIPSLVRTLEIKKTFWCSATLPDVAFHKIAEKMQGNILRLGKFNLPESLDLQKHCVPPHLKLNYLRYELSEFEDESGMIFVSTRNAAERLHKILMAWGFQSVFYHAGMSAEERAAIEKKLSGSGPGNPIWIIATSAFGMGMNYPFLKNCFVFDPSFTLLSLAQAVGRVGRGGALAHASVLWHQNDFLSLRSRITDAKQLNRLSEVEDWCTSSISPRAYLENYFNGA